MGHNLGRAVAVLALAALAACGSSGGGGGGGGGGSGMTATIDGQAFSATNYTHVTVSASSPGTYVIVGSRIVSGTTAQSITLTLYNLSAPGTYPLGVTATNFGGLAIVGNGSTYYDTPLNGAAGTVTVTSLTSTAIAGTFSFVAADTLNAASTTTVTGGSFNIPITGTPAAVAPNQGSSVSATIGGSAWNAATAVASAPASGVYSFGGGTTTTGGYTVDFVLSGVTGPGTYPLSNTGSSNVLSVQQLSPPDEWSSQLSNPPTGSVVITSLTSSRIQGTFSATLVNGSGGAIAIAGGSFNVGLP